MRKLVIVATVFFGTLIGVGVVSETDTTRPGATSGSGGSISHELLQRDVEMTQRMSTPAADGPMQRGLAPDSQLGHARNPGFVQALEQHQADIDRMLARPGR